MNELLEAAGSRFFAGSDGPANICLEPTVAIRPQGRGVVEPPDG